MDLALRYSEFPIGEIATTLHQGPARIAIKWAAYHGLPVRIFVEHWDLYGNRARRQRIRDMVTYCEAAVLLWDGQGSWMKRLMAELDRVSKPALLVWTSDQQRYGKPLPWEDPWEDKPRRRKDPFSSIPGSFDIVD